jgi:hypothetical protein
LHGGKLLALFVLSKIKHNSLKIMHLQEILNQNTTKTHKIEQLIMLGLTRKEITNLIANYYQATPNYGFVQNVYAKMQKENRLPQNTAQALSFMPQVFNKKFGVEIESYGVNKESLIQALTTAGIEVQSEFYNHTTRKHWKIVSDSSIEGEDTFELVSPILVGEAGLEQVKKVCEVLVILKAKINKTCGMHIHFDATDLTLNQWKNIFINYANLEGTIDNFMPVSRRANNSTFCQSIIRYKDRIATATSISQIAQIISTRYTKINAQSFSRHNTIEFRQHSGTVEFEKIEKWVRFLHNLIDYSKDNKITSDNFDTIKLFNPTEIVNFYHTRTQDLAA